MGNTVCTISGIPYALVEIVKRECGIRFTVIRKEAAENGSGATGFAVFVIWIARMIAGGVSQLARAKRTKLVKDFSVAEGAGARVG